MSEIDLLFYAPGESCRCMQLRASGRCAPFSYRDARYCRCVRSETRQSSASARRLARFSLGTGYFVNKRVKGQLISPALSCFPRVSLPPSRCGFALFVIFVRCRSNTATIRAIFANLVRNGMFLHSNPHPFSPPRKSPLTLRNFSRCSENLLLFAGDYFS